MTSEFTRSEVGTKAAWKGFSSQTSYIAYRLMLLNDESTFYPEQAEDLMVKKDNIPQELVQVKNLKADLTLSHLSPQKSDSFFRRCLSYKSENTELILKVVSFGNIGNELSGFMNNDKDCVKSLRKKMLEYGYSEDEIGWLFQNLKFEQIDESVILNDVYSILETKIEAMAAPRVILDVLINYVSNLSRTNSYTSKTIWGQKISELALDLASISGLVKQYGQTLIPIYDYCKSSDYEKMKTEYQMGVDAHPQYIRENLDIIRPHWLQLIAKGFEEKNIVLIRGASGQGKSTLAYRFLLDNYPERDIICVTKILGEENAVEISAALKGMLRNRGNSLIIYIDVAPYDTSWIWLCQELCKHESDLKLIITIREDDFRRTTIDYNKISLYEIELNLSVHEAREIYTQNRTSSFLSFEDAWKSFGEQGPLMEFAYLLNQSDTLQNKLKAQIDAIILEEPNADEWISALGVICYAGKNNIPVNQTKLFASIQCSQRLKMLKIFEKEYFIRQTDNGNIECLHALRAIILNKIISEVNSYSEEELLIITLRSIQRNALIMVVEYIYSHNLNDALIGSLSKVLYDSWQLYAGVLQALLWGSVYSYFQTNKAIIEDGDAVFNGAFAMIGLGDVTGYLKKVDMSVFYDIVKKDSEERYRKMQEIKSKIDNLKLDYHFIDSFLSNTYCNMPTYEKIDAEELSPCGFSLFWMASRNFFPAPPSEITSLKACLSNKDDYLNLLVGIQMQKWWDIYENLKKDVEQHIINRFSIVYLNTDDDEVQAIAISNLFSSEPKFPSNDSIMEIVDSLRKLYINKTRYNVKYIGYNLIEGIELPDMEKHIPLDNLPFTWITQLNRWLSKIIEYERRPNNWLEVIEGVCETRKAIIVACKAIVRGLDIAYRDENTKHLFSKETSEAVINAYVRTNDLKFQLPKCAVDRYGIRIDNSVVDQSSEEFMLGEKIKADSPFGLVFNKYCSSMSNYYSMFISPDNLLIEKLKKIRPSENSRLSLINLISALEEIGKLQVEYSTMVEYQPNGEINPMEEKAYLMLLANMWDYIYHHPYFRVRSLSIQRKKSDEKYIDRLVNLFEIKLPKMDGICSYSKEGNTIFLTIDSDIPCRALFEEFKLHFSDAQTLSYKGYIFKNYLDKVYVSYQILGQELPVKSVISSNSFIIYDDVNRFLKLLMPEQDESVMTEDNLITAIIKCFGNVQSLPMVITYCKQINERIDSLDKTHLQTQIYESWAEDVTDNAIIPTMDAINDSLEYSVDFIPEGVHDEAINIYETIIQMTKAIIDNPHELIELSIDEAKQLTSALETAVTNYFNFFPM